MTDVTIMCIEPDGPPYRIPNAERVALWFFKTRRSEVREYDAAAYDPSTRDLDPNRFLNADLDFMNAAMGTMFPESGAHDLLNRRLAWLEDLRSEWDLILSEDRDWHQRIRSPLKTAVEATWGEGRRAAVTTKLLYLKRPLLFPIVDRLLPWTLGRKRPSSCDELIELIEHLRKVGRQNRGALEEIRQSLRPLKLGFEPSLGRTLEVTLWGLANISRPYDRLADGVEALTAGSG